MEGILAGLGWLMAGGVLGITLMCLMIVAKESDREHDRESPLAEERPRAAPQ